MFLFSLSHKYLVSLEENWNLLTYFNKNFQCRVSWKSVLLFWKFCTSTERCGEGKWCFLQLNVANRWNQSSQNIVGLILLKSGTNFLSRTL